MWVHTYEFVCNWSITHDFVLTTWYSSYLSHALSRVVHSTSTYPNPVSVASVPSRVVHLRFITRSYLVLWGIKRNDWVYRMHGWEGITTNTSEGPVLIPLHHTTVQDTSQPYILLDIIGDYYVISWEIIVTQIMVTLSSDTTKTTGRRSAVLIHSEQRSTLSLLSIDLLETSEVATALVELRCVNKNQRPRIRWEASLHIVKFCN